MWEGTLYFSIGTRHRQVFNTSHTVADVQAYVARSVSCKDVICSYDGHASTPGITQRVSIMFVRQSGSDGGVVPFVVRYDNDKSSLINDQL